MKPGPDQKHLQEQQNLFIDLMDQYVTPSEYQQMN